jgi:hypothetical protein
MRRICTVLWIKFWLAVDRWLDRLDGTRQTRIPLDRKVPFVPNFEEVLRGRDLEDDTPQPNVQGVQHARLRQEEVLDAIHEENVLEAIRGEGDNVHGHGLFSGGER